jgi:ABC-type branched-subunit amino acid transport system substrate-binding protein
MSARSQSGPVATALALIMLTAACGSTVQVNGSSAQQPVDALVTADGTLIPGASGDGLTAPDGTLAADGDSSSSTDAGGVAGAPDTSGTSGGSGGSGSPAGGTENASGGADGADGSGTAGSAPRGGQVGPGVTAGEVLIGRSRLKNAEGANAAMGFAVPKSPTNEIDAAMVQHINSNGGVAGRKIKLNYYTRDAQGNKTQTAVEQEMCEQWTQDNRVFAVLAGEEDILRGCLAKAGVSHIYENVFSSSDNKTFSTFRTYYEINAINLSHLGDAMPDQLAAGGYFSPGAKVGVVTFDDPQYQRAVSQHLKPALAKRGIALAREAYVHTPQSTEDQSRSASQFPSIVLQFKTEGIDHVIILGDSGGGLNIFMTKAAESQDYRPKYGLTSASGPQIAVDSGLVDPNQMKGAVAAGWNAIGDVGIRDFTRYGPGYKKCMSIMEKARVPIANTNDRVVALKTCDGFFFLAAAINKGAPNVTLQSFVAGAESLGAFPSALSYGTKVTASTRDGVAVLATNPFEEACKCFKYKGDLRRLR